MLPKATELGEIDWLYIPPEWGGGVEQGGADLYRLVAGYDDVMFVEYPDPSGVLELVINVRAGKILSDPEPAPRAGPVPGSNGPS